MSQTQRPVGRSSAASPSTTSSSSTSSSSDDENVYEANMPSSGHGHSLSGNVPLSSDRGVAPSSSGNVLSTTLQAITAKKLKELSKKRNIFQEGRQALLKAADLEKMNHKKRLHLLADGIEKLNTQSDPHLALTIRNIKRFLEQHQYDPSVSSKSLETWENSLMDSLERLAMKFQYGATYGHLVNEWLASEQQIQKPPHSNNPEQNEVSEDEGPERERQAHRTKWEELAFNSVETDANAITKYLRRLFANDGSNKEALKALDTLRVQVGKFESEMSQNGQFNHETLNWTIKGIVQSDLLTNEKRTILNDFLSSPIILSEIADVLNMRLTLDTWTWEGNVPVEQRRQLNGKYNMHLQEDLLNSIFLQYIGVKWSVFFKEVLTDFVHAEGTWTSLRPKIPPMDLKRRAYFGCGLEKQESVQSLRQGQYFCNYFLAQLRNSVSQELFAAEGEEEADFKEATLLRKREKGGPFGRGGPEMKQASRAMLMSRPPPVGSYSGGKEFNYERDPNKQVNAMETKQSLLHLLSAELLLHTQFHGEFTCFRSDFDQWEASLPHSTIHTVLKFFGVSKNFLQFLKSFLETPLVFIDDGANAQPRTRRRGVPKSHILSDVLGEVVLFCMDFSVNQATSGGQLYRMSEDFWFWSSSHEKCVQAFRAVKTFTEVMGVGLNTHKSGSVRIYKDANVNRRIDPSLPQGEIRWGFLFLDPITGQWTIDQTMVDSSITELQRQLEDKSTSVFSWIKAFNTYAITFFTSNFGKTANCFGRAHVDMILSTLERVQRRIFRTDGNAVDFLKDTMHRRFGLTNIPDGYLYFPTELGGLELQNPFIGLLQIRNATIEDPASTIVTFLNDEKEEYRIRKQHFDAGERFHYDHSEEFAAIVDKDKFFSFEEFTKYREEFAPHPYSHGELEGADLHNVFEELLKIPTETTIELSDEMRMHLTTLENLDLGGRNHVLALNEAVLEVGSDDVWRVSCKEFWDAEYC